MTDHTQRNARLFGAVASSYDQLGFLALAAHFFAGQVEEFIPPGARVLDIATGTGEVALALTQRGTVVTGIDLAPEMIERARAKAGHLPGLTFEVADASALAYPAQSFDAVVCAAGLFFMPDMPAALREWSRVLRPGGVLAFSSFGRGLLGNLPGLWRDELAVHDLKPPAPPLGRIPTLDAARALLLEAGLDGVQAILMERPYLLPTPEARWNDIAAGLEGAVLPDLPAQQQAALEQAHRARLASLPWPQTVTVPVIVALGHKAAASSL